MLCECTSCLPWFSCFDILIFVSYDMYRGFYGSLESTERSWKVDFLEEIQKRIGSNVLVELRRFASKNFSTVYISL